jgi:hypothetical protein
MKLPKNVIVIGSGDVGKSTVTGFPDYDKEINAFIEAATQPSPLTNSFDVLNMIGGPKPIICKKVKHQYLKNESGVWQCSCGKTL